MNLSKLYSFGSIICYLRVQKHISQALLAKGLCSPSTLSRIELNEREPDKLLTDALLQRLGISPNRFDFILDEIDFNMFQQRETIKSLTDKKHYNFAQSKLDYYESQVKITTPLQEQFIKKYNGILQWKIYKDKDCAVKNLKEALFITFSNYLCSTKSKLYFTSEETSILYEIASIFKDTKDLKNYNKILSYLISYLGRHDMDEDIMKQYMTIVFSEAHFHYLNKDYKKSKMLCEKGITKAAEHNHLHCLAELLCLRAASNEHLFSKNMTSNNSKSFIKDYLTAITLFSLNSKKELIEQIELHLKENYPWEYIQSEMLFKSQEFRFL